MILEETDELSALDEQDETAWPEAMAGLVLERRLAGLDDDHLGEYLADMARRDWREVDSRLAVLIAHLWKWTFQPERRSGSWRATVEARRRELARLLESGPLCNHAEAMLARAYADGVRLAAAKTDSPVGTFPLRPIAPTPSIASKD